MTYDGVPGGFAFNADGGMLPPIVPPIVPPMGAPIGPDGLLSAGAAVSAAGCPAVAPAAGGGGGLGSAQAAAKTPIAITPNQVRVTSASLPIERGTPSQDTEAGRKLQNRATFH